MTYVKEQIISSLIIFTLFSSSFSSVNNYSFNFLTIYKPSPKWQFNGSDYSMFSNVRITSDGNNILGAETYYDELYVFNSSSSQPVRVLNSSYRIMGNFIVQSGGNKFNLLDINNLTLLWSIDYSLDSVLFSSDGNYAFARDYKTVYFFEKISITPKWILNMNTTINKMMISSDGSFVLVSTGATLYVFNSSSSVPLWSYVFGNFINILTITNDNDYIAIGIEGIGDKLYLFHITNPIPLWSSMTSSVKTMVFSSDGSKIVVGEYRGISLFNVNSSTPVWYYSTSSKVGTVAISSSGSEIIAGSNNNYVYLFNNYQATPTWSYNTGSWVYSVSISSDGTKYVAGSGNHVFYFETDDLYEGYLNVPILITISVLVIITIIISLVISYPIIRKWKLRKKVRELLNI